MVAEQALPARPALRFHGGKWRAAPFILSHLPEHHTYVEPYGGGASILLRKVPAPVEVYNDLSHAAVRFFRVLRERPAELIRAIQLTPYARAEFQAARQTCDDDLEAARRFYILSWQGRGGPTAQWNTGWRFQRTIDNRQYNCASWDDTEHLWAVAGRLKHVQIECDDALAVIARYDRAGTVFVCDPPYVSATRSKWYAAAYEHEMGDEEHRALAATLHGIAGMAVVCGYPCPLYDDLYGDWTHVDYASLTDAATTRTERLWLSPAVVRNSRRPGLFDTREEVS
jgi:DNA adenine methylase